MSNVTMRQLLESGAHFGHQTRFWSPKMAPYIYGHRNKIHIINLEQTLTMFNDAMNYVSGVAGKRGTIMFVGTKRQASQIIQTEAKRAKCPYVYHRWLGGMLTNYSTVRRSIERLQELDDIIASEGFTRTTKKEAMRIEREHFRLNRNLAGIRAMRGLPDALFVIDVKHEKIAVLEANKLGIPVVAVVDTNCNPDGIDYVIPGNDDSISAIRLYCTAAADAVLAGYESITTDPFMHVDESETSTDDLVTVTVHGARAAVAPSTEVIVTEAKQPVVKSGSVGDVETVDEIEDDIESEQLPIADEVQSESIAEQNEIETEVKADVIDEPESHVETTSEAEDGIETESQTETEIANKHETEAETEQSKTSVSSVEDAGGDEQIEFADSTDKSEHPVTEVAVSDSEAKAQAVENDTEEKKITQVDSAEKLDSVENEQTPTDKSTESSN